MTYRLIRIKPTQIVRVVQGVPSSLTTASAVPPSGIDTIAWSPCSQHIMVAQSNSRIRILDPVTLEQLRIIYPPPGTKVFGFSPGSPLLLCCGVSLDPPVEFVKA